MRPETLVVVTQGSLRVGDAPARRTRGRTRNPSDYKALRMDRECPNIEVHDIRGIFRVPEQRYNRFSPPTATNEDGEILEPLRIIAGLGN